MKIYKQIMVWLAFFIIFIAILFGVIALTSFVWQSLENLFQTISALDTVLIIALISGTVTVVGLIVNSIVTVCMKRLEYRNKRNDEMRAKMEQPYRRFVDMVFDIAKDLNGSRSISKKDFTNKLLDFYKEVVLYGSNNVVRKWNGLIKLKQDSASNDYMEHLEEILYVIREDLGIKRKNMEIGEILSPFMPKSESKDTMR